MPRRVLYNTHKVSQEIIKTCPVRDLYKNVDGIHEYAKLANYPLLASILCDALDMN